MFDQQQSGTQPAGSQSHHDDDGIPEKDVVHEEPAVMDPRDLTSTGPTIPPVLKPDREPPVDDSQVGRPLEPESEDRTSR